MVNKKQRNLAWVICAVVVVAAFVSLATTPTTTPTAVLDPRAAGVSNGPTNTTTIATPISIGAANVTTVAARGEVSVYVDPDIATVSLGVSTTDKTAETARVTNTKSMNAVVDAVKKAGVAANDIQTSNVSIYPTYDYQTSSPTITGYQVSNTVTMTVRDLSKIADIVNAALKAGANQINGINFDLQDKDSVYSKALGDATKKAASKAKVMAEAAGLKIGDITSIVESGAEYQPYTSGASAYVDMGSAAVKDQAAVNLGDTIQVGQINVYASVTVTYSASK